jgi:type IV pilus assembly protein PilB
MSELDIAEKRVPQDGRFRLRVKGRTIDFRVSVMPSIHGEDVVIRILDKESINAAFRKLRLDVLGLPEPDLRKLRKYITEPYGMVVVTGPPAAARPRRSTPRSPRSPARGQDRHDRGPGRVPDPADHAGPGEREEGPHLRARAALDPAPRPGQDHGRRGARPETAQIAVQSALTGHLVFTTVHANNVFDVIGRFIHMGVEPYNFVSALNCVMAQRLVRVLCTGASIRPRCRSRC